MPKFKKSKTSGTTIADEVATMHGIAKKTMRELVRTTFLVMVKQFFETGYLTIPDFATISLELTVRSGTPKVLILFRPSMRFRNKRDATLDDIERLPFLNYILARDEVKSRKYEIKRVNNIVFLKTTKVNRLNHERDRVVAAILAATGVVVDPQSIAEEHLIPPQSRKFPLPDHCVEVRELIAALGVIPLELLHMPEHLKDGNPSESPQVDSVPVE